LLGTLRSSVAGETGIRPIPIVAPACHDTGCAVAAVPTTDRDYIYISSGTWSLMGVEISQPIISQEALKYNFANEGGANGTFRFLKNIIGLWPLQECRREWARQGESFSYEDLTRLASGAPAFGPLVSLGDNRFHPPGDMPARIQGFCRETGQSVPESKGEIVRCLLESLALEYRRVAQQLDEVMGCRLPKIHIVGGGSRNELLNRFAAGATGRTVVAGPSEATAIGNVLVQALALGDLGSLAEGRDLVRRSFALKTFEPGDTAAWDEAYQSYTALDRRVQA
jgi:rhamnulokinase